MSQSTIKMDKGYYGMYPLGVSRNQTVAIHNKNGQGLLQDDLAIRLAMKEVVAIHNKNGQGLLRNHGLGVRHTTAVAIHNKNGQGLLHNLYL